MLVPAELSHSICTLVGLEVLAVLVRRGCLPQDPRDALQECRWGQLVSMFSDRMGSPTRVCNPGQS